MRVEEEDEGIEDEDDTLGWSEVVVEDDEESSASIRLWIRTAKAGDSSICLS